MNLATQRVNYDKAQLTEETIDSDPFKQFNLWFNEAIEANMIEPNAMTICTCTKDGFPSARCVLLKSVDDRGFTFYTNYESRKGKNLEENPAASLLFWWDKLQRQIRVEGRVEKTSTEESDAYFKVRPRGSQLSAWVSHQSSVIEGGRKVLEDKLQEYEKKI